LPWGQSSFFDLRKKKNTRGNGNFYRKRTGKKSKGRLDTSEEPDSGWSRTKSNSIFIARDAEAGVRAESCREEAPDKKQTETKQEICGGILPALKSIASNGILSKQPGRNAVIELATREPWSSLGSRSNPQTCVCTVAVGE